jgi:hypothetical protein
MMRGNQGRRAVAVALLAGVTVLAAPHWAQAAPAVEQCPGNQTLVSLDEKVCPPNAKRPAVVVRRACCEKQDNKGNPKVHCKHFPHCPNKSPSE